MSTLDDISPGLAQRGPLELHPIHPAILEVGETDRSFAFVVWSDPGGPEVLHDGLQKFVEAGLLAELSRPAAELRGLHARRRLVDLRLLSFVEVEDFDMAVAAFGFHSTTEEDGRWRQTLAHVRGESTRLGRSADEEPVSRWIATFGPPPDEELAQRLEEELRARVGDEIWGEKPGMFFAILNEALEAVGEKPLPPKPESVDWLEERLVSREVGPVRWIPPLLFQCLCDVVSVVAAKAYAHEVQWAPSEIDDRGFASPPMIRARPEKPARALNVIGGDEGWVNVPLGVHLLRWLVMPIQPGEEIPPLGEWIADQFSDE